MTQALSAQTEYPPARTPDDFVRYHYQLFTGYIAAAVCGASQYTPPSQIWTEWLGTYRAAVERARRRALGPKVPAIEAGHHWEADNCTLAALVILGPASYRVGGSYAVRECGPVVDRELPWLLATVDARLQCRTSTAAPFTDFVPPLIIESKYKCRALPHHPDVEHLLQVTHQMRVLGVTDRCYIAYAHRPGATEAAHYRDGGALRVRVFEVRWSAALWAWMFARMRAFKRCVDARTHPSAVLIDLSAALRGAWFGGVRFGDTVPPLPECPAWRLVGETDESLLGSVPPRRAWA